MEKILVTGANGFIGSNLVKRLTDNGNIVSALVRKTSDLSFLNETSAELVFGDITDIQSIDHAMKGVDKVYHVAGLAADWGPYKKFENINYQGTINVAESANRHGVKKLVYISTVAFHGFGKVNMNEESPPAKDLIPYAKTKYLAEMWLWEFSKTSSMKITVVRPGNVYGINDRTFMLKYLDAMISGKFAQIGRGKSKTCPVYIENLIDIITLAGDSPSADGEAFIATDGLDIDWNSFNSKLARAAGVKMPSTSIAYWLAYPLSLVYYNLHSLLGIKREPLLTPYRVNNGGRNYHFSIKKLEGFFGYEPAIGLEQALKETVEWYYSNNRQ